MAGGGEPELMLLVIDTSICVVFYADRGFPTLGNHVGPFWVENYCNYDKICRLCSRIFPCRVL